MDTPSSFEERCDKLLYDLRSLAEMGESIAGVRSVERAASEVLHNIMGTVGASKGALLTLDGKILTVTAARGARTHQAIPISEQLLTALQQAEGNLLPRWEPCFPEELKAFCTRALPDIEVVVGVILRAQRRIIGLLALSRKFMHQDYLDEDLEILDMACRHVSVALYNFDLRRKTRAANFLLSRKVLQLESLHDLGLSVAALKPKEEMLQEVLHGSISLTDARKAFFLGIEDGELVIGSSAGVDQEQLTAFIGNATYARKLLAGESLLFRRSRIAHRFFDSLTFLAVPVQTSSRLFGALAVIGKEAREKLPNFTADDKKLLEAFATVAAVALENLEMQQVVIEREMIRKEIETAAAIHQLIVPRPDDLPVIKGFDIYGYNYPCKEIGGDYFDIIPLTDSRFAFIICDVSGKGLSAALLVSTLQATFHSLFQGSLSLEEIADKTNQILYRNTTLDKYSTGFIGIVDTKSGNLETINAGHFSPFLIRTTGEVEQLRTGGLGFGMFDFATFSKELRFLSPGDTIYLYTDGITEAFSPDEEEFGTDRLEAIVASKVGEPPRHLLEEIEQAVRDWTKWYVPGEGFPHDDFTQLAIQMNQ